VAESMIFQDCIRNYLMPRATFLSSSIAKPRSSATDRCLMLGVSLLLFATPSAQAVEAVTSDARAPSSGATPSRQVHAFYYPWYGNPKTDGKYSNWNHPVAVRRGPPRRFPGGDDIGANFYPALGCYSVNDAATLDIHMRQLRRARVGVISVSWWGKNSYTDRALPLLFRIAAKHGIQVNFHIEPHLGPGGRNATKVRQAIVYLLDAYGQSPALYREPLRGNRPMFYIYDSYLTSAEEWATVLAPDGEQTIRGTPYDSVVIGLWVKEDERRFFLDGHFDGCYTYFASDGFTYGSTLAHWSDLAAWARTHGKLFVPCVAPGYIDTRIRPWNGRNTRGREEGAYYDREFLAAIEAKPDLIGITSFNEWHEGTQIEPAVTKAVGDFRYEDYAPHEPTWYLDRTAHWVGRYAAVRTR
jgi:glycoprotein endo-alpha-1,2-mannosidase